MPFLSDYYLVDLDSEWKLRKHASEVGILFQSAIKMRLRYAVEAAEIWAEAFEPQYWRWIDNIINLRRLERLANKPRPKTNDITEDMIEQARNADIRSVVDFHKGKATAWCHEDKNPSLIYMSKTNKAWCASCGKYFDPIGVLMTRDGLSFPEAVKQLCR